MRIMNGRRETPRSKIKIWRRKGAGEWSFEEKNDNRMQYGLTNIRSCVHDLAIGAVVTIIYYYKTTINFVYYDNVMSCIKVNFINYWCASNYGVPKKLVIERWEVGEWAISIGYCPKPTLYGVLETRGMLHNRRGRSPRPLCNILSGF